MPGRGSSWGGACLRGPRATEITPGAAWNEIEEKLRKRGQGGTVCWISREPGEGACVCTFLVLLPKPLPCARPLSPSGVPPGPGLGGLPDLTLCPLTLSSSAAG